MQTKCIIFNLVTPHHWNRHFPNKEEEKWWYWWQTYYVAKRDSPSRVPTVGQGTLREDELMVEAPNENQHHQPSQWADKASNNYFQGWDMRRFQCPKNVTGKVCGPSWQY